MAIADRDKPIGDAIEQRDGTEFTLQNSDSNIAPGLGLFEICKPAVVRCSVLTIWVAGGRTHFGVGYGKRFEGGSTVLRYCLSAKAVG